VPRVNYEKLSGDRIAESSDAIRRRVQVARDIQLKRFAKVKSKVLFAMQTCILGRSGNSVNGDRMGKA
jgi:predicted ATPase with chaperone activity